MKKGTFCFFTAWLAGASAWAGSMETFGFGGVGIGRGGAETAGADDFSATFYNPARLIGVHSVSLGLGYNYSIPHLYAENDFKPIAELKKPPEMGGMHLGFQFPLGGKVEDRVVLGIGIYLPTINIVRTQSIDEKQPQFYMFTSNTDKLGLVIAVAVKILDEMSVGVGLNQLAAMGGAVNFTVNAFDKRFEKRDLSIDLINTIGPIAGVSYSPTEWLRVGLAYRGELELHYGLPTSINLGEDVGSLALNIEGIAHWTPHTVSLGAWGRLLDGKLALMGELGWQKWSSAPRDQVQVAMDLSGKLVDGLGLGSALDLDTSADPGMKFQDIFVPRVGAEYRALEWLTVRAGYFYRPSPVPDQTQRTNYLDNNTHGLSGGVTMAVDDPLEVFSAPVQVDLWTQASILAQRAAIKLRNINDPVGSYRYGGVVWHLGAAVRYTLK